MNVRTTTSVGDTRAREFAEYIRSTRFDPNRLEPWQRQFLANYLGARPAPGTCDETDQAADAATTSGTTRPT
jgi:hypothetical protein